MHDAQPTAAPEDWGQIAPVGRFESRRGRRSEYETRPIGAGLPVTLSKLAALAAKGGVGGVRMWIAADDFARRLDALTTRPGVGEAEVQLLAGCLLEMAGGASPQEIIDRDERERPAVPASQGGVRPSGERATATAVIKLSDVLDFDELVRQPYPPSVLIAHPNWWDPTLLEYFAHRLTRQQQRRYVLIAINLALCSGWNSVSLGQIVHLLLQQEYAPCPPWAAP